MTIPEMFEDRKIRYFYAEGRGYGVKDETTQQELFSIAFYNPHHPWPGEEYLVFIKGVQQKGYTSDTFQKVLKTMYQELKTLLNEQSAKDGADIQYADFLKKKNQVYKRIAKSVNK